MKNTHSLSFVFAFFAIASTLLIEVTSGRPSVNSEKDLFRLDTIHLTLQKTLPTDYKKTTTSLVKVLEEKTHLETLKRTSENIVKMTALATIRASLAEALKEKTHQKTIERARSKDGKTNSEVIVKMAALASKRAVLEKAKKEVAHIGYWQTVYSIESKQGKQLYRPKNKTRSCTQTASPCGHHQLTAQALNDIGCASTQCLSDRLDYNKSLKMSQKLLALNERRLKNIGIVKLDDYQKYLIHQQGASGIKNILRATTGNSKLSKEIRRNMANNSPLSYGQYKQMGSQIAAQTFLDHWETKWINEKRLIAKLPVVATDNLIKHEFVPRFSDKSLEIALNK